MAPPDATSIALVQAVGTDTNIEELAREFARRVAASGGDLGVVEHIATKFEMASRTESYSYSCGTTKDPRTCWGTRTVTYEIATTSMIGHAFRTEHAS